MQWLRLRPESPEELDMVDWRGRWIDEDEDGEGDEYDEDDEEAGGRMEDFDQVRLESTCRMTIEAESHLGCHR
jgi:casein kinase II subunit beta